MSCNALKPSIDYSGVPPGSGPISVLRLGKDVMPFRQGTVLTTSGGDYIPPSIMPGYGGHLPGISTSCGTSFGGATQRHFRTYRQELLSRQVRPKMVYGRFPCDFTPFPDVAVAQKAICSKKLCETANIRSPGLDFNRRLELLQFYQKCQNHRDYYLDKSGKLAPEPFFYVGSPYPVRCPVDERIFKISRSQDACNKPGFLGSPPYCGTMPCVQKNNMLQTVWSPTLRLGPCQKEQEPCEIDRGIGSAVLSF